MPRFVDNARVEPYLQELLRASRGLAPPLRAYAEETSGKARRQLLQVADDLESEDATKVLQQGRQFNSFLTSVLCAGADPATSSDALTGILSQVQDRIRVQRQWARNLAYPTALLLVFCVFAAVMWGLIVPQFRQIYYDFETELPAPTLFILNARPTVIFVACLVACLLPACLVVYWLAKRYRPGWRGGLAYRLPIVGRTLRYAALARFAQTTAALVSVEAPLADAVRWAARSTLPAHLAAAVESLPGKVVPSVLTRGRGHAVPATLALALQPGSPITRQIGSARLLRELAQDYEARARSRLSWWARCYEPLFVLLIGGVVGFTVLALFLPLVSLIQNLS